MIDLLDRKYNLTSIYTDDNVLISGSHTHSGPGGFLMDFLFDLNSLGFVPDTFHAMTRGIARVSNIYSYLLTGLLSLRLVIPPVVVVQQSLRGYLKI